MTKVYGVWSGGPLQLILLRVVPTSNHAHSPLISWAGIVGFLPAMGQYGCMESRIELRGSSPYSPLHSDIVDTCFSLFTVFSSYSEYVSCGPAKLEISSKALTAHGELTATGQGYTEQHHLLNENQ